MKERETQEEKLLTPEEYIKEKAEKAQDIWYSQPVLKIEDALQALQLLKDQHNKELKEIRDKINDELFPFDGGRLKSYNESRADCITIIDKYIK